MLGEELLQNPNSLGNDFNQNNIVFAGKEWLWNFGSKLASIFGSHEIFLRKEKPYPLAYETLCYQSLSDEVKFFLLAGELCPKGLIFFEGADHLRSSLGFVAVVLGGFGDVKEGWDVVTKDLFWLFFLDDIVEHHLDGLFERFALHLLLHNHHGLAEFLSILEGTS
jgi:hypothetical protein